MSLSYTVDRLSRVEQGRRKEGHIAKALKEQHGLILLPATEREDKELKIDRWLVQDDGKKQAVQIKYRETGQDILFEVFDRFEDWDSPSNKPGRDMIGQADLYACLIKGNCYLVETGLIKNTIRELLQHIICYGWTQKDKFLKYRKNGVTLEIRIQYDNASGARKMIAYIPVQFFQVQIYKLNLPKK